MLKEAPKQDSHEMSLVIPNSKQFQIYMFEPLSFIIHIFQKFLYKKANQPNKKTNCLASYNPVFSKFAKTVRKQFSVTFLISEDSSLKNAKDSLCFPVIPITVLII